MSSARQPAAVVAAALVIAATVSVVFAARPPQQAQFKSGTQIVSLFVTVADAQRRLVQFYEAISENGKADRWRQMLEAAKAKAAQTKP